MVLFFSQKCLESVIIIYSQQFSIPTSNEKSGPKLKYYLTRIFNNSVAVRAKTKVRAKKDHRVSDP